MFFMFHTFERRSPSNETEANKKTYHNPHGLFAESCYHILKALMSQNVNGSETHLPLIAPS
jgi:hypothetical protein